MSENLRDRYAKAMHKAYWEGDDSSLDVNVWFLADAVLAVRDDLLAEKDAEIKRLRQGVWDMCIQLGMDYDGDLTPDHVKFPDIVTLGLEEAREARKSYDESLDESIEMERAIRAAEAKLARVEALIPIFEARFGSAAVRYLRAALATVEPTPPEVILDCRCGHARYRHGPHGIGGPCRLTTCSCTDFALVEPTGEDANAKCAGVQVTGQMSAAICDSDGWVRSGTWHWGTDYQCTGSVHLPLDSPIWPGREIRCANPIHNVDWCEEAQSGHRDGSR